MTERIGRSRLLGGRYEIGEVLGYGGMAEVFRGRDIRLSRDVAVKVLRNDLARDPSFQHRFRREAQAAASLNHPSIVAVYDTGEELEPDNGQGAQITVPYIVMEYVEGRTLRDVMQREGRLTVERSLEIVADVCDALEYSHRTGIIHRDIKPGNVMLTREGVVKVMDFGIARAVTASSATMTQTAAVIGTAQYLSPEQARGESVDPRSDVYSTGILLYELLTGVPPFRGDSPVAVAYQHVREDPRPPSTLDPDIPRDVDAVVMKALAKNPDNRYGSAAEMRDDLLRAAEGRPVYATPLLGEEERTAMLGEPAAPPLLPPSQQRSRRGLTWLLVAIGAVVVFALAAIIATTLLGGSSKVTVPPVAGSTEAVARLALNNANLQVGQVTRANSASVPTGRVISSDPSAGSKVSKNSQVDLVVSAGVKQVQVPQLQGLSQQRAEAQLQAAGLKVGNVNQSTAPSTETPGTVLGANPAPGSMVPDGTSVDLTVVSAKVPVPDVRGKTEDEARSLLGSFGFRVSIKSQESTQPTGTVLAQSPAPNSSQDRDATITLTVSQQVTPSPTPTPTPTGTPTTTPTSASPTPKGEGLTTILPTP
jgi:eukaryotic-like serine/threonine-protein kinase